MGNIKAPIIIEGAMEFELDAVIASLDKRENTELFGFPVVMGSLDGYPVVAARTRIGVINTALITTLLVDRFHPLCLLSQGTAGSHLESLHVGDMVLGEKIVNINCCHMDKPDCRELESLSQGEWREHRFFTSSPALLSAAEHTPYSRGKTVRGVIGSGDFWSHDPADIHAIQKRYGTYCEEMESFAAAQICTLTGTPFLCMRIISNNELNGEAFENGLALACQNFALDTVRTIIRDAFPGDFPADECKNTLP